ncbi:MAG: type II toxin-antitoxin system HicA family toxin [Myxococcales bacterium]|nr:type II toxin-antitoxin system HicA family toxin [Myxococcales bacterium]
MSQVEARRLLRVLLRLGWAVVRTSGRHQVLSKPGHSPLAIPVHPGCLKEGTARAILKQAGLTEEEFFAEY